MAKTYSSLKSKEQEHIKIFNNNANEPTIIKGICIVNASLIDLR